MTEISLPPTIQEDLSKPDADLDDLIVIEEKVSVVNLNEDLEENIKGKRDKILETMFIFLYC